MERMQPKNLPHVVIVGGGFGGLYAAKNLSGSGYRVTLVDKRNFHLFQPLLYQVATGGLSAGDIASPLRSIFEGCGNIRVIMGEVTGVEPDRNTVILRDGELQYDRLILATGGDFHYFGHDEWACFAPGLKSLEDALDIRHRVFLAFEAAEREPDPEKRRAWLNFVIVGGGPTGVELAGALAELARHTLKRDFRSIDPASAQIYLLEGADRILPPYPPDLSEKARQSLEKLGVNVSTSALVTNIGHGENEAVTFKCGDKDETLHARTVLWAAGVKASGLGKALSEKTGCQLDRGGRVIVKPDFSIPDYPDVFVIGDLARYTHTGDGKPLPGLAPVAMQEGAYVAKLLKSRLQGQAMPPFRYRDKGTLAVIGRNAAVAVVKKLHFSGFPAWFLWVAIHITYLIEFDNKLLVLIQWCYNYITKNQGARLITMRDPYPLVCKEGRPPVPGIMD